MECHLENPQREFHICEADSRLRGSDDAHSVASIYRAGLKRGLGYKME